MWQVAKKEEVAHGSWLMGLWFDDSGSSARGEVVIEGACLSHLPAAERKMHSLLIIYSGYSAIHLFLVMPALQPTTAIK